MTPIRLLFILSFSLLFIHSSSAQGDDGWWKNLFKKETSEGAQSSPSDPIQESEEIASPNEGLITAPAETIDTVETVFVPSRIGQITVSKPAGISKLDSLYRAEPPTLRGYRIQIYFGDLSSAREKRLQFISANEYLPCYMVQNAPNFAVLVGDFRTHLDAYRTVQAIKATYPLATIVPAKIEPPTID
jgi:hypothetical protein